MSSLNQPNNDFCDWRVTNWAEAVRVALGSRQLVIYRTLRALLLVPSIVLAGYSIFAFRPGLLIWVALGFIGFAAGNTRPTLIGVITNALIALVGFVCSLVYRDEVFVVGGVIPGLSWLGSCALLGTTAQYLIEALQRSEDVRQVLIDRGVLIAVPAAGSTDSLDPRN